MFTGHIPLNKLVLNEPGHMYQGICYLEGRASTKFHIKTTVHTYIQHQTPLYSLSTSVSLGLEVKLIPFLKYFINAGNKIDLADKREVSQQRAAEFSEAQDMYYLETSAKESDNVEKLFLDLACRLISEARQNTLVNNVSSPLPGEGKSISYLTCCNFN